MSKSKTNNVKESPVQSSSKAPPDHQLPPGKEPKLLGTAEHQESDPNRGQAPGRLRWIVAGVAVTLLALFVFGLLRRHQQQKVVEAAAREEERELPVVNVMKVRRSPAATTELLPGNMTPLTEAYIYARANGYVKKRYVDIGDRVKQGQLLAEIEAPDLDQQVQQARAALAQAEQQVAQAKAAYANAQSQEELARVTWERYKVLVSHGAVAKQDADQQYTTYRSAVAKVESAQANINAAEQNTQASRANLDRLSVLQAFEQVRAPFSGVITARNFDVGALVGGNGGTQGASTTSSGGTQLSGAAGNSGASGGTSGGTGGSSGELFRLAQIGTLRILVNVPQESAPMIRVGEPATVLVAEYPGTKFEGRVARTSNSIDMSTRTLLTEVDVANPNQKLLPGTYAQVQIENVRINPPLLVTGDSIMAGANGIQVAVLTDVKQQQENSATQRHYPPDAKQIHIVNVQVGRDYGAEIEIVSGLKGGEDVVVNPSDDVEEGAIVKPQQAPRRGPSTPAPGKPDSGAHGASEKRGSAGK